jgi:hypothetical protein
LNKGRISKSLGTQRSIYLLVLCLVAAAAPTVMAQTTSQAALLDLPDAPGTVRSSRSDTADSSSTSLESPNTAPAKTRMASRSDKVILPDEQAPSLTAKDKFLMGARHSVTPFSAVGWLTSAGWSQLTNSAPNYGTDKGAFGQRLGATALRSIGEGVFSTSVMANIFHEDPRYYRLGRGHSIAKRVVYAATRAIITRTDSGKTTPNLSLLSGNLTGAALTNAYYPPLNHGAGQTMLIFGSSVGGSALGFEVSEFLGDALELIHLKKSA